jgi:hypothetical protein
MKDTIVNIKYSPIDNIGPSVHSTILIDSSKTTHICPPDSYTLDEICPINQSIGQIFYFKFDREF